MKRLTLILTFVLIFLIGALSQEVYSAFSTNPITEVPYAYTNQGALSPSDHIQESQIKVEEGKVCITGLPSFTLSRYADSGSMKPTLHQATNGIEVEVKSPDDIQRGDIIAYEAKWAEEKWGSKLVVHRVIEKGYDQNGFYVLTKGDNNVFTDPKVRINQIKYLTVGLLY